MLYFCRWFLECHSRWTARPTAATAAARGEFDTPPCEIRRLTPGLQLQLRGKQPVLAGFVRIGSSLDLHAHRTQAELHTMLRQYHDEVDNNRGYYLQTHRYKNHTVHASNGSLHDC